MTAIIEQISKVLTEAGIEHFCDPQIKNWKTKNYGPYNLPEGTTYKRIYTRRNYTIFCYYFDVDVLYATVPKKLPPDEIKKNMN